MGELGRKLRAYGRVARRTRLATTPDLVRRLRRRPSILGGVAAYELGLIVSGAVDARLKTLAALKASAQIGCPF